MPKGYYHRQNTLARFLDNIAIKDNGCWEWQGYLSRDGYGYFSIGIHNTRVHRWSYEYYNQTVIPFDKQIDHLCRNRKCANPNHLEMVTCKENTRRGTGIFRNSSKTHCPYGHPYDNENTYHYNSKKGRDCKECHRIKNKLIRDKTSMLNAIKAILLLSICIEIGITTRKPLGLRIDG